MTDHVQFACPGDGRGNDGCRARDGMDCVLCALSNCVVCGGAEAAMPTDCPGSRICHDDLERIMAGTLDFRDGQWVAPSGPKSAWEPVEPSSRVCT